jgi:hypothetical protein
MTLNIFSLGGIFILLMPLFGFAYLALGKAFLGFSESDKDERVTFRLYASCTAASFIYFISIALTQLSS